MQLAMKVWHRFAWRKTSKSTESNLACSMVESFELSFAGIVNSAFCAVKLLVWNGFHFDANVLRLSSPSLVAFTSLIILPY